MWIKSKIFKFTIVFGFTLPILLLSFQNCSQTKFVTVEEPSLAGLSFCDQKPNDAACVKPVEIFCEFNGEKYKEGQTITAYQRSTVPFIETCKEETRTCEKGSFSGSFQYSKCSVGLPADCQFDGKQVSHGSSVKAFLNSTEKFGQTCQSQDRICNNGVLSGSYNFSSCQEDAPADCLFNGVQIKHGNDILAYKDSSVPFGFSCESEIRRCFNGALTGQNSYATCAVAAPKVCLFNGKEIAHGDKVPAFQNSTVPFGQTCQQEDRICNNGVLSGAYAFASCEVNQPAVCIFNGQQIAHGQTIPAFKDASVPVGAQCVSEDRLCTNGNLSGSFANNSCVVDTSQEKSITVSETNIYAPFKLLLIIDDSYTMTQSQAQISKNIDSLLLPLKGQNVDVKIVTTSDGTTDTTTSNYFKADGTIYSYPSYVSSSSSPYKSSTYVSATEFITVIPRTNSLGISLLSTDSEQTTLTKIQTLKNNIIQVGTNGSDSEKVLCPLLRELSNKESNAFFKAGDKAAIVVLSDENDTSNSGGCVSRYTTNYGVVTVNTSTTPERHLYSFSQKSVKVGFQYTVTTPAVYRDGILVSPAKTTTKSSTSYFLTAQISESTAASLEICKPVAYSKLSNSYTNLLITSCELVSKSGSHFETQDTQKNLCDQTQKSSSLGNKSLSEFWTDYTGNCTRSVYAASTSTSYDRPKIGSTMPHYFENLTSNSTDNQFDAVVNSSMSNLFGNNYFMSFIINKTGQSCNLKTGQSYGTRYEQFAALDSQKIKTYSICDSTYAPALSQVSDFISKVATTKYSMNLPTGARLLEVYLNGVKLENTQYAVLNGVLEVKTTIQKDDQIKLVYAPR